MVITDTAIIIPDVALFSDTMPPAMLAKIE
jgi:hypothetical protein